MDPSPELISAERAESKPEVIGCPTCAAQQGAAPEIRIARFGDRPLQRCRRCGARWAGGSRAQRLLDCERCGGIFETDRDGAPCPGCLAGALDLDPGRGLVAAAEAEARTALARDWTFERSPTLATYLDRVCCDVARSMPGAFPSPRVVLVAQDRLLTFSLPSGIVFVSRGAIASLADEAELAFLFGHELAHAVGGSAACALVRAGLRALGSRRGESRGAGWLRGIEELLSLGYGDGREHAADGSAIEAVVALGYDADSVRRCLTRLEERIQSGETAVAEWGFAHPPVLARLRHLERRLAQLADRPSGGRSNREVFRRAAGHSVLTFDLRPARIVESGPGAAAGRARLLWLLAAACAAALLFGLVLLVAAGR